MDEDELTWEQREWISSVFVAHELGQLPQELALAFIARIRQGEELYIYRAAGSDGPWNLWVHGMRWALAPVVAAWGEGGRERAWQ